MSNKRLNLSRRTVLKQAAAGSAIGTGVTGVSGSQAGSDVVSGSLVSVYGSLGSGLTRADIVNAQNRALETYRSRTGDTDLVAVGAPEARSNRLENDLTVVSYAIRIYPDGTSKYDAQVVTDEQSEAVVRAAHQNTREFVERVRQRDRAETYATTSSSGDASFEYVSGGGTSNNGCPEGTIRISSNIYEWQEEGSSRTIFAAQQNFRSTPGYQVKNCNGRWYSGKTETAQHRWRYSSYSGPALNTFKPRDGRDGERETTSTITESGASISWNYSQPDVYRKNDTGNKDTDWFYRIDEGEKYTHVWETGSECEFDRYQNSEKGDWIVDGYFKHKFYDRFNYGRKTKDVLDYYFYGYG